MQGVWRKEFDLVFRKIGGVMGRLYAAAKAEPASDKLVMRRDKGIGGVMTPPYKN